MMRWDGMMIMMSLHSVDVSASCIYLHCTGCMVGVIVLEHWGMHSARFGDEHIALTKT